MVKLALDEVRREEYAVKHVCDADDRQNEEVVRPGASPMYPTITQREIEEASGHA